MKMNRTLTLLAGIALLGACKKDDEPAPADVALSGKWNKVSEYRTITQGGGVIRDTINYAPETNNWTFDTTAKKIYRLENTIRDTIFYKLVEENTKIVTAADDEFAFRVDTITILSLENNRLKVEGHRNEGAATDYVTNFSK